MAEGGSRPGILRALGSQSYIPTYLIAKSEDELVVAEVSNRLSGNSDSRVISSDDKAFVDTKPCLFRLFLYKI